MSTKQEYIAEADCFLVQAGLPTYSDLIAILRAAWEMSYDMDTDVANKVCEAIELFDESAK